MKRNGYYAVMEALIELRNDKVIKSRFNFLVNEALF